MKKLVICTCRTYHRIPQNILNEAVKTATDAGITCEIVPDLCREGASGGKKFDDETFVFACQTRAIKAMFGQATNCMDIREISEEKIQEAVKSLVEPEEWIPWFPVIDETRCIQCGKCADFCMFGVYAKEDGRIRVVHPASCKTDCPACSRICPANAIIFPKSNEARLNGALSEAVKPSSEDQTSFRERLEYRKKVRLFREN